MSPWASPLFVPGNREDLVVKVPSVAPAFVILDLEDAVPADRKDEARNVIVRAVDTLASAGIPAWIRTNAPTTAWFADDADLVLQVAAAGAVVPKVETQDDLRQIGSALSGTPCIAGLETVRGVADAAELLVGQFIACYFGAEDYVADLGGFRTGSNIEVLHARSTVAVAARCTATVALDMVTLDHQDLDRFTAEARQAAALGYRGKLCIHPAQVPVAARAFEPSADDIKRAQGILEAYRAAVAEGRATTTYEGSMVDEVIARLARATLERVTS